MIRIITYLIVIGVSIPIFLILIRKSYNNKVFFNLDYIQSHHAEIVLHIPTVIPHIYDFKQRIYSHYMTTIQIGNVSHVFYRDMNQHLLSGSQSTMRITTTNGIDFSEPIEVFTVLPQAHNFAPFLKDGKLFATAGGHSDVLNLYESKDDGLSWTFVRKLMDACFGECLDSMNLMVDDYIYGRNWDGGRIVNRFAPPYNFNKNISIFTNIQRQLYTSGIFKYTDDMYVGVPMIFNGENNLSYTKLMYSEDGLIFDSFDDIWFEDDSNATYARGAYVAPGIYKTNTTWYMYGMRNYGTTDIYMSALTLRPYGFTSVWSANGYIKVKMECDRCYANIKGYFNGVYVDSLKYKINCQKKIPLNNTHIYRLFCE